MSTARSAVDDPSVPTTIRRYTQLPQSDGAGDPFAVTAILGYRLPRLKAATARLSATRRNGVLACAVPADFEE
jgi:hypothetical protein